MTRSESGPRPTFIFLPLCIFLFAVGKVSELESGGRESGMGS